MDSGSNLSRQRRPSESAPAFEALEGRLMMDATWSGADWDGDAVSITLVGEGTMAVTESTFPNPQRIMKIELLDTDGSGTTMTINVRQAPGGDGYVNIGRITGGNNVGLHLLNAPKANIVGTATTVPNDPDGDGSGFGIDFLGFLRNAVLHDIRNGVDIFAKQPNVWYPNCAPSQLTINDIGDNSSITLGSLLEKFTLNSWGTGGALDVKAIGVMNVKGAFGADVTVLRDVGPVTIGGALNGSAANASTWNIPRGIGAMKIGSIGPYFSMNAVGSVTSLAVNGNMSYASWTSASIGPLSVKGDMAGQGGTFRLTQDFDPANLKLLTLGATTVTGAISGNWDIDGHTGAIKAGAINGFDALIDGNVPSVAVGGDMTFNNWTSLTLGSLTVKNRMTSTGTMRLTQGVNAKPTLGKVTVGFWMDGVSIRSRGNIGPVTAAGMDGVNLFAGVKDAINGLTGSNAAGTYLDAEASIASVTIKGVPGANPWERHSMYDTDIIASRIGAMKFYGPDTSWIGPNGVAARTIASLSMQKPDGTKYTWSSPLTAAWPADAIDRIDVRLLV